MRPGITKAAPDDLQFHWAMTYLITWAAGSVLLASVLGGVV